MVLRGVFAGCSSLGVSLRGVVLRFGSRSVGELLVLLELLGSVFLGFVTGFLLSVVLVGRVLFGVASVAPVLVGRVFTS